MRNALLVVALAVCGLATVAQAGTITLSYTGIAYNLYSDYPPTSNASYACTPGSNPCSLDVSLTINAPLGDNLSYANVTANTFVFTDGVNTITNLSSGITSDAFIFSTDGSGNITQWQVVVQTSGAIDELLTLNYPGDQVDVTAYNGCQGCPELQYYAYANGTWTEGPTPSPTPEPASLALISTGMLALLGLAWRERRARAL